MAFKNKAILILIPIFAHLVHADQNCANPPPGVAKMVRGVDITTLDMVPIGNFHSHGVKNKIIDFTCEEGKTWMSPSGKEYQLPDQIWHITTVPGGWLAADVSLFKTSSDIRKWMNGKAGVSGFLKIISFSASGSYKKMQTSIVNSSFFIEDVTAFESATRVDLIPKSDLKLDDYAQSYIDQSLNGTFESNRTDYEKFIDEFGTHYFATANFGGVIRMYMETTKEYVYSKSDLQIKSDARTFFFGLISLNGGVVSRSTTVSETFKKATSVIVKYYGGDTNLLKSDGIQRWQPTVDNDPWLFSGTLRPITDLITDETKKASMVKAVNEHAFRSYLEELLRLTAAAKQNIGNDATLKSLISRINTMKLKPTLVKSEVKALGTDITDQLIVPTWFMENTQLCYKWHGGKCNGRQLCSKPVPRTLVDRDHTDVKGSGWRMQWKITSDKNPSWFSNVKVCYRWYADGDKEAAPSRQCASLNKYTAQKWSMSDKAGRGCKMSWKIIAPSSAPIWLKYNQLCYDWPSSGDGSQCGSAPIRTLCVKTKKWTPYYYISGDNSANNRGNDRGDNRGDNSGGCKIEWGVALSVMILCSCTHLVWN